MYITCMAAIGATSTGPISMGLKVMFKQTVDIDPTAHGQVREHP